MDQTGVFTGSIIGDGTKLRAEHYTSGGTATVLSSHNKNLIVIADKKWTCEVSESAKLAQVGDVWIHVTHIGTIDVVDGWMAVNYHGTPIVKLITDLPNVETPPDVPPDQVVTNSITYDYNVNGELVAVWVNGEEWRRFHEPPIPPMGVSEGSEG